MAQVAAFGSQTHSQDAPRSIHDVPHGIKRPADTSLEHEQRLSKRFDLLNLLDRNGTRLHVNVPGLTRRPSNVSPTLDLNSPTTPALCKTHRAPRSLPEDGMLIEDTPNRIYIHDLAAELSDIESDDEMPIFLSDIERHLSKIPRQLLRGPEPKASEDNQLILYTVPSSLSVPEERDGVRKAIAEARRRIREAQASGVGELPGKVEQEQHRAMASAPGQMHQDEDAMEID